MTHLLRWPAMLAVLPAEYNSEYSPLGAEDGAEMESDGAEDALQASAAPSLPEPCSSAHPR